MVLTNLYRVYGTKDNNRTDDFARDMHWLHGPEIPEVTCTRRTSMFFLHETSLDMGYQPGGEIMASLLPVVTHMQKLSY
jgi:hypothetical protein